MPKYLRRGPRMNPSSKASMVSRPNANLYTSPISMLLLNELQTLHRQRTAEMAEVEARLAALEAEHQEKEALAARLTALEALVQRLAQTELPV